MHAVVLGVIIVAASPGGGAPESRPASRSIQQQPRAADPLSGQASEPTATQPTGATDKSPGAAAALSTLFPGSGHIYLGDRSTGLGLILLGAAELVAVVASLADGWPTAPWGAAFNPAADPGLLLTATLYQNTWTYGIFAAYRDARLLTQNRGYRLPVPKGELRDLLLAPLNPDVMFEPEVGLGLIGMVIVGLLVSHLVDDSLAPNTRSIFERRRVNFMGQQLEPARAVALGELYYLGLFIPVGIGEEAFFRGFLQSSLAERLGPWGGWGAASLMFGAAHVPNALLLDDPRVQERYLGFAVPLITALGAYMGWVFMINDYSLAGPVALHFWYDFILSAVSFALSPDSQPFAVRVALPL